LGARISNVIGYTVKVLSIEFGRFDFSTFGRLQHAGTKQPPTKSHFILPDLGEGVHEAN